MLRDYRGCCVPGMFLDFHPLGAQMCRGTTCRAPTKLGREDSPSPQPSPPGEGAFYTLLGLCKGLPGRG